jgi:PBP1b-binding outer membrane lipoprotein LpoB
MIKISLLILSIFFFNGCVNRHGISAKYYSDCKEYYDMQGYYHKECGDDDVVTYDGMADTLEDAFTAETKPKGNVW